MVNLTGLSLELMANTIVLVAQPFSLLKFVCMFGLRTFFLVTHLWLQLVKAIVNFHVDVCWKIMVWTFAFVSLPVRILTALQRERLLEVHLLEMQVELENLTWDKEQLDEQLQITIKDCRMMGTIISELEEEHVKAVARIELLEDELQDLKDENVGLTAVQGNGKCYFKAQEDVNLKKSVDNDRQHTVATEYGTPLLKTGYVSGDDEIIQEDVHSKAWGDESKKVQAQPSPLLMIASKGSQYPGISPEDPDVVNDDTVYLCREVALSQSIFSAILSLLVGMIIWEAEDPCMPLVISLFIVVGMSLRSVVQLFSTIENRPASDAVALLSFNWFVLGTLTYPTLPIVVHVLTPLVLSLAEGMIRWLGISCPLSK